MAVSRLLVGMIWTPIPGGTPAPSRPEAGHPRPGQGQNEANTRWSRPAHKSYKSPRHRWRKHVRTTTNRYVSETLLKGVAQGLAKSCQAAAGKQTKNVFGQKDSV